MVGQSAAYLTSRGLVGRRNVELPAAPALAMVFLSRPVPVLAEVVVLSAGAARVNGLHFLLACGFRQLDLRRCPGAQRRAGGARMP